MQPAECTANVSAKLCAWQKPQLNTCVYQHVELCQYRQGNGDIGGGMVVGRQFGGENFKFTKAEASSRIGDMYKYTYQTGTNKEK